uniref:Zinc finger protein 395b n=1 Tax=Neolamprologus brichardi TaxID=32507 RepID=A0A3Q4HP42_NEOBR
MPSACRTPQMDRKYSPNLEELHLLAPGFRCCCSVRVCEGGPDFTRIFLYVIFSFRSPESVEMDEIMAAMVLTSLSCSPVVQSSPQTDPGPAGSSSSPADMECGGGELSDSGSSGYWSWDHGNVSPAPSPSVTEMDSSPDEGLHMELEQGEELSSVRSVYRCLWPSCGKVLTSSVGIKRHIRVLHLGGYMSYIDTCHIQTGICSPTQTWTSTPHLYWITSPKPQTVSPPRNGSPCTPTRMSVLCLHHISMNFLPRKVCGRGEAKKCRKVYGVERKDQWCTACRWKKACQRFPD